MRSPYYHVVSGKSSVSFETNETGRREIGWMKIPKWAGFMMGLDLLSKDVT